MLAIGVVALLSLILPAETNPNPTCTGICLDLLDLEWWQTLFVLLGALGLSPAPWIAGLSIGRIQFSGVARKDFERQLTEQAAGFERQLTEKDAAHARELAARDTYHEGLMVQERQRYADSEKAREINAAAAETEKQRAERATNVLVEMTEVVAAAQHFMRSQLEAGERAVIERGSS